MVFSSYCSDHPFELSESGVTQLETHINKHPLKHIGPPAELIREKACQIFETFGCIIVKQVKRFLFGDTFF
jgi:hypothetical protein